MNKKLKLGSLIALRFLIPVVCYFFIASLSFPPLLLPAHPEIADARKSFVCDTCSPCGIPV